METFRAEGDPSRYTKEEGVEEDDEEETGVIDLGPGVKSNTSSKRGPKPGSSPSPPCCQADDCHTNMNDAKQYHQRHKVCEYHAKAPVVLISGQEKRFCQQCSRFHELSEFDNSKRSCRKRLAGYNERRRKFSLLKVTVAPKTSESANQLGIFAGGVFRRGRQPLRSKRTRDFLHLILSYPIRIGYEDFLKERNSIYQLCFADDDDADFEHLLPESPLRYVQALIPEDITEVIINGGRLSTETALKHVPKPILLLATHLALHQLTLTLTSENIQNQNIWFSTGNDAEKQTVVGNIQANSQIGAAFDDFKVIDLNQIDAKIEREMVLLNPAKWLEQTTSSKPPTKYDRRSRHLVLVVDGDGYKKLQNTRLPNKRYPHHVVVFITSAQQNDYLTNNRDLTIKTDDHLLPWEVFCSNVGSELLHSSIVIQEIAVQIVEKCGGHLLAIILMAKSLKHVTDVQIWELALKKLLYRDREAIVNAFFNFIWANAISEREKVRLIRCLMVFKFPGLKMNGDQLFARWFSEQLVDTEEEAKSILQKFMECSVLLKFEDTLCQPNIHLPGDIGIILQALREESTESLSEGALASIISDLQVLNLSNTHLWNLYDANTWPQLTELNLEGRVVETLPKAIFKLQNLETLSLKHCSQLLELPPLISKLENLKTLILAGCERLKILPHEIWELQKLETLSLAHCSQLQELPPLIAKLENLETLILAGCELLETLPQDIWELQNLDVCGVSGTQIMYLPQFLNLPKLRKLLLGNNLNLIKIPSSFFDHVPLLSTLDLSHTSIHELPSSIFNLQELRELYLKDCELFLELPPQISLLKNLTSLGLEGTLITHLPTEIQELINLESLSLSLYSDSNFAVIPLGVLSKLIHLQVLRIGVNSDNEWWFKNVEHILAEINGLKMLRALDMYIPKVNSLNLIKRHLSDFRFIIGHHKPMMTSHIPTAIEVMFKESSPSLKFVNGQVIPNEAMSILSEANAFFLDCHMKINNLTQFGLKNLKQLRLCILAECNEMQSIVDMDEYEADLDLNESFCMQFLTIFYLKNLTSIINKPIHGSSIFCELKLLALHTCPELTTIFTMHSLCSLVNLEELIVDDCPKVCSIISCPPSEQTTGFFLPKLRKLSLLFVPELTSISNGVCIGRNLEEIGLYYCPKLQSLSTAELSSEELKVIRAETEWWKNELKWSKEEWGQEDPPHKFNKIFSPIDEDLDIFTQLTTYELTSSNREKDSESSIW